MDLETGRKCVLACCLLLCTLRPLGATKTYTRTDMCKEIKLTSSETVVAVDFTYNPSAAEYNTTYECRTTFTTSLDSSGIVIRFQEPTQLSQTGSCDNHLDIVFPGSNTIDRHCTSVIYTEIVTSQKIELNFKSASLSSAHFKLVLYTFRHGRCHSGEVRCVGNRCIDRKVICALDYDVCGDDRYNCPADAVFYAAVVVIVQVLLAFGVIVCCLCKNNQQNTRTPASNETANQNNGNDQDAHIDMSYFAPPPAYETLTDIDANRFVAQSSSDDVKFTNESGELFNNEAPPPYDKLRNDYRQMTRL